MHHSRNILTLCVGKSTYARCGVLVNITPFEPEWEGYPTLEITNISGAPAKVYANEGIAQVIFLEGDETCLTSYRDKAGKYQDQKKEITMPRI
jgi:dCTP deaminase